MGTKVVLEAKATVEDTVADYSQYQSATQAVDLGGFCEVTAFMNVLSSDLAGGCTVRLQTACEPFDGAFADTDVEFDIDNGDDEKQVAFLNKFGRYVRWTAKTHADQTGTHSASFSIVLFAKRAG